MTQAAGAPIDEYALVADLYDHVWPYQTRRDVQFFVDRAVRCGGQVLEVGCGSGRVLIPTARAGVEITGLDASPAMLDVCRRSLAAEADDVQRRVQLHHGDMRCFDLGRRFALITLPFRPFQHLLTVDDQLACLGCLRRHLAEGGRLILDLFNPSLPMLVDDRAGQEHGDEPEMQLPDGCRALRRMRIVARDPFAQVSEVELIYYVRRPEGEEQRRVHRFRFRHLFRFEAEHLLVRAGFRVLELFGDYDGSPYGARYPGELIFVAAPEGDRTVRPHAEARA